MASHEAARRAVKAGYRNVSVMGAGIAGWHEAGLRVEYPSHAFAGGGS